jgi:hypothetical protein
MTIPRAIAVAAVVLAAIPATAQVAPATRSLPRVEFGIGAGSASWFGEGHSLGAVDLRVTARLTRRFGVEFVTDVLTRRLSADRIYGIYILQGTYLAYQNAAGDLGLLATFGALGGFESYHTSGGSWTAPDGTVYGWPAASRTEVGPLTELVGGLAVQKVLARHLALRADAQVIVCAYGEGVGLRLAGGVSVPIGHYGTAAGAGR